LYSNTIGYSNTANGVTALLYNTTGYNNTATGREALYSNTTGYENTANGYKTLYSNTTGYENTANGHRALHDNTTGNFNTANGNYALDFNTTGSYNTANGIYALRFNTTGTDNTALGRLASVSAGAFTFATAIGSSALTNANEKTVIGRNVGGVVIGGYANWSNLSDGRFKEQIKENVPGMDFIRALRPVTYTINIDQLQRHITAQMPDTIAARYLPNEAEKATAKAEIRTGFIAQEVEATAKKIGYNFDGVNAPKNETDNYSIAYGQFVPSMVKGMQEQDKLIQNLETQIEEKDKRIEALETRLAKIEALLSGKNSSDLNLQSSDQARLDQNNPNPFNGQTQINYYLPASVSKAQLRITDASGRLLKVLELQGTGEGQVNLNTNDLPSGGYQYSLVLDGRLFATKQMVLTKMK
jgi:hypothetical protein